MKKIFKTSLYVVMATWTLVSCAPQEGDDYSLGEKPEVSQLSFSAAPSAAKANVIEFSNNSSIKGVTAWDFGNGTTAQGDKATASYPFKGDYTVSMTVYTTGGSTTITQQVSIADDDMSLLDTPMYSALTGGADNLAGKTWVFDQYHAGHFGVGPGEGNESYNGTPAWWSCPAEGKLQCSLYSNEFTFIQVGVQMIWKNNGYIYTNEAGKNALGKPAVVPGAGDFDVEYVPAESYTYTLDESAKTLTLSNGAFMGHYAGSSTYKILKLTADEMYLEVVSAVESGNGWWYRFVPKEKNVKPEIPVKAAALAFDFEEADGASAESWQKDQMGDLTGIVDNPAPVPSNESLKAFRYQKTESSSSNIFFQAAGYKFDLTELNKIRMKVYIPSYNDYVTEATKEDWATIITLQKQIVVKLHNSEAGDSAWESQAQIEIKDLETDKWLDLEFDFSDWADRKDFDKIVIQFGAEGHHAPGIFFFDDFIFDK